MALCSTKNLDFSSLLQLDGRVVIPDIQNALVGNARVGSRLDRNREGEINADEEGPASCVLFSCAARLSASVRPSQWQFLGHSYRQDRICNFGCNGESDAASHRRFPRVEDR